MVSSLPSGFSLTAGPELQLPSQQGMIVLNPGSKIVLSSSDSSLSMDRCPSPPSPRGDAVFQPKGFGAWHDPANWRGGNAATPHLRRIPCRWRVPVQIVPVPVVVFVFVAVGDGVFDDASVVVTIVVASATAAAAAVVTTVIVCVVVVVIVTVVVVSAAAAAAAASYQQLLYHCNHLPPPYRHDTAVFPRGEAFQLSLSHHHTDISRLSVNGRGVDSAGFRRMQGSRMGRLMLQASKNQYTSKKKNLKRNWVKKL